MEMREAAEAYKKWAKYGVWPTLDGERLGHLVMQKVEQLQRQRRSTLPIDVLSSNSLQSVESCTVLETCLVITVGVKVHSSY